LSRFICIFLSIAVVTAAAELHSGTFTISKYGSEFLKAGVGARAEGMGNAQAAIVQDATSIFWNPGGLVAIQNLQLHAMHSERFNGIVNSDFIGIGIPFGENRAVGFGIYRMGIDGIPITRLADPSRQLGEIYSGENGQSLQNVPIVSRWVNDQEMAFLLTYSIQKSRRFSLGVNLKSIVKNMGDNSAWGLGFDFGFVSNPYRNLQLGLMLKDATSTLVAWHKGRTELISPRLRLGLGYPFLLSKLHILPVLDAEAGLGRMRGNTLLSAGRFDLEAYGGLEIGYNDRLFLRFGLDRNRLTFGTGFHFSIFYVDYSYSSQSELGNCHRISTTIVWDKKRLYSL
jgi:hypothetical protein